MRFEIKTAVSLAALLSAAAITNVHAADLSSPAPMAPSFDAPASVDWNGFFIGGGVGSQFGVDSVSEQGKDPDDLKTLDDFALDGGFGFVEGGYDFQADRFVFGVNASYDFSLSDDGTVYQKDKDTTVTETLGDGWSVGARAGMLITDETLFFISAGYTTRDLNVSYVKEKDSIDYSEDFNTHGYYVGAGLETMVTDNLSLKAEYRYSQYDTGFNTGVIKDSTLISDGFNQQQVRASLSWRF